MVAKRNRLQDGTRKPPSLGDVAAKAGVSTATVSRFLANPDQVREERRLKIQAAVDALGYIPHAAARALASNRTYTIGAIVPTLDNAIFARGIQALQERLQRHGYTLIVASSNYSLHQEKEQAETLIARGIDGLFLVGLDHDERLFERLDQSGTPFVNTWAYDPTINQPCIGFDNQRAARRLTEYLIDLGHTRFGVISAEIRDNDRAANRLQGIRDALARADMALADEAIVECHYDISDGRHALRRLLGQHEPPTAVVCGNDVLAYGAMIECQESGLKVPGDISVIGFDDLPLSQHIRPSLTTIHVPSAEMGRRAADYLVARLAGQETAEQIELEVSLVVRASTARPGSG